MPVCKEHDYRTFTFTKNPHCQNKDVNYAK